MARAKITFELHSYWHMGSGGGEGANSDALVARTPAGLPFIPGRTVKGLLREGVQQAEEFRQIPAGTTLKLFGGGAQDDRFGTVPGTLAFSSAALGDGMEEWARNTDNARARQMLYRQIAATRIDERGQAEEGSLRRMEVAVPLLMEAEVECLVEVPGWREALCCGATLVRSLGVQRQRGLGRATILIGEVLS